MGFGVAVETPLEPPRSNLLVDMTCLKHSGFIKFLGLKIILILVVSTIVLPLRIGTPRCMT